MHKAVRGTAPLCSVISLHEETRSKSEYTRLVPSLWRTSTTRAIMSWLTMLSLFSVVVIDRDAVATDCVGMTTTRLAHGEVEF